MSFFVKLASGVSTFSGADVGHDYILASGAVDVGDLLIIGVNVHDGTCDTPSGFLAAAFDVSTPQGVYVFYRIASGGEDTVNITTNADRNVALSYLRYSGANSSPLDEAAIGYSVSMVQESPSVTPNALFGYDELGLLYSFNDNSTSEETLDPIWPVGYPVHINTGPGTVGYGTPETVQHFVAVRDDASGVETPKIHWEGGEFVNRVSIFVAFSTVETSKDISGRAALGVTTLASLSKRTNLTSTAAVGLAATAHISKTISVATSVRIIAIMDAILAATELALIPTLGGAIARPVLAPSIELVGLNDQLSVTVDYTFRVNTPIFTPIETDSAATASYLVVVFKISVFRALSAEDLLATTTTLTAATSVAVADAIAVRAATESSLVGLTDVHGYQMGTQNYVRAGSALTVFVRMEL